jgi:antitoxin FitA
MKMAMPTICNVTDEVHRALCMRAAQHGHSMQAEVRQILESAANPEARVRRGSLLADMVKRARPSDKEFSVYEQVRSKAVSHPVSCE